MASRFLVPLGRQGADPLFSIYREMNRMFDDALSGSLSSGGQGGRMSMPSLDVQEKDDELCVAVELPGVRSEDVDVRLERDVLTISGEKKAEHDEKQANYHVMERSYGRFSRSLQLPFTPDPEQVSADYEHGVLKVTLKRAPQQQGSRRIQVRSGAAGAQLGQQGSERSGGQSYAQGQGQGQGASGGQSSSAGSSSAGSSSAGSSAAGSSGGVDETGGAGDGNASPGSKGAGQRGGQSSGATGRA